MALQPLSVATVSEIAVFKYEHVGSGRNHEWLVLLFDAPAPGQLAPTFSGRIAFRRRTRPDFFVFQSKCFCLRLRSTGVATWRGACKGAGFGWQVSKGSTFGSLPAVRVQACAYGT